MAGGRGEGEARRARRPRHVTPPGAIGRRRRRAGPGPPLTHPAGRAAPCPGPAPPARRLGWSPGVVPRNASPSPPPPPRVAGGGPVYLRAFPSLRLRAGRTETAMEAGSRRGTIPPPSPSSSFAFLVSRCDMRGASRSVGAPSLLLTSAVLSGPGGAGKQCRLGCNGVTFIPPLPHPGLVKTQKGTAL